MPVPTDQEIQFATLERAFRDLLWANVDVIREREGDDRAPDPALVAAMEAVRHRMEAVAPDRCATFTKRLGAHLQRYHNGPEEQLMRPKVVNRHHYRNESGEPDHKLLPRPWIYIGRGKNPSPLANPFKVEDHGDTALSLYRTHLWTKIKKRDPKVMRTLAKIQWDTHLVCSCAPRPCHGDVVVTAWDWLQRQAWWSREEWLGP